MRKEEIINIQKEWASGIIKMGRLSNDRESLESFTSDFLDKIYDFQNQVLFKPTKAANEQFRNTKILLFPTLLQVIIEFVKKITVLLYQTGQKYFLITQTLLSMKI